MDDETYFALQIALIKRPEVGAVIPGSGGLRKIRWPSSDRGKRGGVRVIYYWITSEHQIYMLYMYPKNVRDNLTPAQLRILRRLIEE